MNSALVPVKALTQAKSRLLPQLKQTGIHLLMKAMLSDVLQALKAVEEIELCSVVTPDPEVAKLAESMGVDPLLRTDSGLNPSLAVATKELEQRGAASLLIVPGDLPTIQPREVTMLYQHLKLQGGSGIGLVPANDGGTAALLRSPPSVIPTAFGPESANAHRILATTSKQSFFEIQLASFAFDLDEAADLDRLLQSDYSASATREALRNVGWNQH